MCDFWFLRSLGGFWVGFDTFAAPRERVAFNTSFKSFSAAGCIGLSEECSSIFLYAGQVYSDSSYSPFYKRNAMLGQLQLPAV